VIGRIVRGKRIEMGLSLRHLAERTHLTPSFLSQVERDLAEPSVASLRRIAEALKVPIFYFFLETEGDDAVVRGSDCRSIVFPSSSADCRILTPNLRRKIGMLKVRLAPGDAVSQEPLSYPGEECTHVLSGTMKFVLGKREYHMETGDSIYYFSSVPHSIVNGGHEDLEFISAVTPPGF